MAPSEATPLHEVLQMGLEKYLDELMGISSRASKEFALEKVSWLSTKYFKKTFDLEKSKK